MRFEMVMLAFLLSIAARIALSARLGLLCLLLAGYSYARSLGCKFVVVDLPMEVACPVLCIYVYLSNKNKVVYDTFSKFLHYLIFFLMSAYGFSAVSGGVFSSVLLGMLIFAVGFYLISTVQVMSSTYRGDKQNGRAVV